MKKAPYANAQEMGEIMIFSAFQAQIDCMAGMCQDKSWRRRLKCINTYAGNIIRERLECMEPAQLQSLERRCRHTFVKVLTSDQYKRLENNLGVLQDETYNLERDDYFDLLEQASLNCMHCSQGEKVAGCKFRQLLHKLSAPVIRDNPAAGECEYRLDNEVKWVAPDGKRLERL